MHPHTFLRSLLLAPLVIPLLVLSWGMAREHYGAPISGGLSLSVLMAWSSLFLGGLAYFVTASILWIRIGRCRSRRAAITLIFMAPLFFIPLQLVAILLLTLILPSSDASLGDKLTEGFSLGLITAVYVLIFGYFYAPCAAVLFLFGLRVGLVSRFPSDEPRCASQNAA